MKKNNNETWDLSCALAYGLYDASLQIAMPSPNKRVTMVGRLLALFLAAAWVASEQKAVLPWKRGKRDAGAPALTRDEFLFFASEVWDNWAHTRPASHLTVIAGNNGRKDGQP